MSNLSNLLLDFCLKSVKRHKPLYYSTRNGNPTATILFYKAEKNQTSMSRYRGPRPDWSCNKTTTLEFPWQPEWLDFSPGGVYEMVFISHG
ncbi:uncharacterized [Tachysurus ichikawai]